MPTTGKDQRQEEILQVKNQEKSHEYLGRFKIRWRRQGGNQFVPNSWYNIRRSDSENEEKVELDKP